MVGIIICLGLFGSSLVGFIGGYCAGRYEGYSEGYYDRANSERV